MSLNSKPRFRPFPSSTGNHKSRRNVRQIQNQLDSLKARERSSLLRNSVLLSDIFRLKKQVTHMNVSFNKLERARDSYDRYVENCMVTWVQKAFRESGTGREAGSSSRPETEPTVHLTPTKTIGVQTTQEHLSLQFSDWSISPETESRLVPAMHSTMLVPTVTSKPPRDTSQRHTAHSFQTRTDTSSLVPPIINFSDLRTPNIPPDATLLSSYDQSNYSYYPRAMTPHPEYPVPIAPAPTNPGVSRQPLPSNSTPTLISDDTYNPAYNSLPNVSMIAPQEGMTHSQHSYMLPQQPAPTFPTIPTRFMPPPPSIVLNTVSSGATIQPPNIPQVPNHSRNIPPERTSPQPISIIQQPNIPQVLNLPPNIIPQPRDISQEQTTSLPSDTFQPPPNIQDQLSSADTTRVLMPAAEMNQPQIIFRKQTPLPPSTTLQEPIESQEQTHVPSGDTLQPLNISEQTILPLQNTESGTCIVPQIISEVPPHELEPPVTLPLNTSDILTLSPQSAARRQVAQPLRHYLPPQANKPSPPPPIYSVLSPSKQMTHHNETQFSHSRSPNTLPTIPEPEHEIKKVAATTTAIVATYEPLPAATNTSTSTGIKRVPSAYEFPLQHLVNLERRATLDWGIGEALGSEFELKFSLNPSVSVAPTDTTNPLRRISTSNPTLDILDNGVVSESSSSQGDKGSEQLASSRNQFDLTASNNSDEEMARKPSHIMVDTAARPPASLKVIGHIGAALNAYCLDTTVVGRAKLYDGIASSDVMKAEIKESEVLTNRILSMAETPNCDLTSWDVQTLGAIFLSEISKYVAENVPILTGEMLSLTPRVNLESFNRLLPIKSQDLWCVISEHFASLVETMSADEICTTFTPRLMKTDSCSEDLKKGAHILVGILNEMFELEMNEESFVKPSEANSSDSDSKDVSENREDPYLHLLKSMTTKSVDRGVKSGHEEGIESVASSIVSEGSAVGILDLMVSPAAPQIILPSPTQLLEQAVGEKIESSDSESIEESDIYVPDFGGSKSMSDHEKKQKLEKLWGSDMDSGSETESVKPIKKKVSSGMDDFDFFD